ncbi:hypothetical protein Tco_0397960 [Tanacetum coccineum]
MYDDMSYTMLHEMMKKKFNLEADDRINLSIKLPSFDIIMDITDNDEMAYENPQPVYHKWKKFMSFKPDIPETPLYKSKSMISKHYKKDPEVKIGNTFDNKEALDLAVRLKALEEGYQFLSKKQIWIERKNQRTVTGIKTDNKGVFEMLFITLGASIRTFLNYLRPLLIIDAAYLKGEYKGTNLVAVRICGNNQIMPVAFGICKGETALAVHNEFPLAFYVSYTPDEFTTNMNTLLAVQPDAYHKLCEAGPQRWSRAHCPLIRYNYMTSNSVESVNACTVLTRKLPITKLAETYRAMLQDWYFKRQEVVAVTGFLGLTDCLQFVSDWIKKDTYQGTYAESIHFIGDMQEWEFPSHIHPAIPPRMDNPQTGWRKNTNRMLSQGEEP